MEQHDFGMHGDAYQNYSKGIRGRIRHELVFEAICTLAKRGGTVLDMGCGDGEISTRMCQAGFRVFGVDTSLEMLRRANLRRSALPDEAKERLDFEVGDVESFESDRTYDLVCCHGVLMYLDDSGEVVQRLADLVSPGGVLSVLSRNALSGGVREALRGEYKTARQLIEARSVTSIGNLGVATRGDDPFEIVRVMESTGLDACEWRGIRIFSDHLDVDSFDYSTADELIALERTASAQDPYRTFARMFHATGSKPPH